MKLQSGFVTKVLAAAFTGLVRLLFRTLQLRYHAETPGTNPYDPATRERFLYCVWHDSVVIPAFAGTHRATAALTSRHADGTFVAEILQRLRIAPIRGSTGRLGQTAYRELLAATAVGHLVITPDGPRGPFRQMSDGIVQLASRTGLAIIPTAYTARRAWRIAGTWTYLLIPCPFTRVCLLAGKPIYVPPNVKGAELELFTQRVQQEMDRLGVAADRALTQ